MRAVGEAAVPLCGPLPSLRPAEVIVAETTGRTRHIFRRWAGSQLRRKMRSQPMHGVRAMASACQTVERTGCWVIALQGLSLPSPLQAAAAAAATAIEAQAIVTMEHRLAT